MLSTKSSSSTMALVLPAVICGLLPAWSLLVIAGATIVLTAVQIVVTQVIRLRASAGIVGSEHALRVIEIEDLPRRRRKPI